MTDEARNEAIGPHVMALLELFEGELQDVRFPDIDGGALALSADEVREKAALVQEAEAALAAAQKVMAEAQEALLGKTLRAFAYARIFAEGNDVLMAKLEATGLTRAARRPTTEVPAEGAARRRGRPPKIRPEAPLFVDTETAVSAEVNGHDKDAAASAH